MLLLDDSYGVIHIERSLLVPALDFTASMNTTFASDIVLSPFSTFLIYSCSFAANSEPGLTLVHLISSTFPSCGIVSALFLPLLISPRHPAFLLSSPFLINLFSKKQKVKIIIHRKHQEVPN